MRFPRSPSCAAIVAAGTLVLLLAGAAAAQIAPARSIEELKAETQARADRNAYPLTGLKPDDVREALSKLTSLDRDQWATAWSGIGDRYVARAKTAEGERKATEAQQDYLQAWRYYSFGCWPVDNSPGKKQAYARALEAFRSYARLLDPPLEVVRIPFEGREIVGYLRLPRNVRPAPIVVMSSALDSRKEDGAERGDSYIRHGIAFLALDMPGTGEAPLKAEVGAERMYSRALDDLATRPEIDANRMVMQGGSWSGYWAAKLGFVERARLKGVVVQGGPVHYYFQPDWQKKALGTREYLFDLFPARASIYGVDTLEAFLAYGPKLSLKEEGFLGKPSAPMLLVNGDNDTQVPIADLDLLLHSGTPKDAWVNPGGGHMGRSAQLPDDWIFEHVVLPWVERRLATAE